MIDPKTGEVIAEIEVLNEPAASPASSPPATDQTPHRPDPGTRSLL